MNATYKQSYQTTPLAAGNADYVEALYERFLEDPAAVPEHWATYFRGLQAGAGPRAQAEQPRLPVEQVLLARARTPRAMAGGGTALPHSAEKQAAVIKLIESYRGRGHLCARLDPLGLHPVPRVPDLELAHHGLGEADMSTVFSTVTLTGPDHRPLSEIWAMLRETYLGTIGFEFMHVTNSDERLWLAQHIEQAGARRALTQAAKLKIFNSLASAEGWEKYLHTRYVGQKRFSIEGAETLIALLHDVVNQASEHGVKETVIGMAHRGRLNVLINVLGKSPQELFTEFAGTYDPKVDEGSGDVKYHLGFSTDVNASGGTVHVALAFNPSHLEVVNPVVEGSVRARQDRRGDTRGETVLPVLIHGDAALSGQGVCMEVLQLSQARGFGVGGTLHIVLNNQIGFTISNPRDARSTLYCTDIAKMLEAPVFHVNGDDPEAAVFATRLALEYREKFHKDVFVDVVCYRRHGHNEADEPAATQPVMYKDIRARATTPAVYAEKLQQEGVLEPGALDQAVEAYRKRVSTGQPVAPGIVPHTANQYTVDWGRYHHEWHENVDTKIQPERLQVLAAAMNRVPEEIELHPTVARIYDARRKMAAGAQPIDWGFAETLAYASLVTEGEGYPVRLTGQDTARGTFFHRQAVLHNQKDGSTYTPLEHIAKGQKPFTVVDSLLSELGVMAFEYGYSTAEPDALVIWEAQFGDFANGAQVVVDQFVSAGEAKWGRLCGLVLFLPHGYEGQGPEHSSARLERYLQLCAEHNMQVCVPTTPAQMFHMLRRQVMRPYRKPLAVMTPKSLLRHKLSVSSLEDLTQGHFHVVIPEVDELPVEQVKRVVFCAGKVYYDLLQARRAAKTQDVAIVRLEQLYPFPQQEYADVIRQYRQARDIVWCQEEPENQGAWYQIRHRLQEPLASSYGLRYVGRAASASPAAGYSQLHKEQQNALIQEALGRNVAAVRVGSHSGVKARIASEKA